MADWDPESSKPRPLPEDDYDLFLPSTTTSVRGIKRKFNPNDPENDDDDLYTDDLPDGSRAYKYSRVRTYETYTQNGDPEKFYDDSVAMALHDPETDVGPVPGTTKRLAKGAYFYPVMQRTGLRPKRNVGVAAMSQGNDERVDEVNLRVKDMGEFTRGMVLEQQAALDPAVGVEVEVGA